MWENGKYKCIASDSDLHLDVDLQYDAHDDLFSIAHSTILEMRGSQIK